jgi:hypothetical protein
MPPDRFELFLSRLTDVLKFGPLMLAFYILILLWVILVTLHLRRRDSAVGLRRWSYIICGMKLALGPAIWILDSTNRSYYIIISGGMDPYLEAEQGYVRGLAALIVLGWGAFSLCLTGLLAIGRMPQCPKKEE